MSSSSLLLQGNHLMPDKCKRPCHVTYVSAVQAATGDLSQNGLEIELDRVYDRCGAGASWHLDCGPPP